MLITTANLDSTKPELRLCAGSNPTRSVLEIHDGDDLWQWSRLEIKLNAFCRSTIQQKNSSSSGSSSQNFAWLYQTNLIIITPFDFLFHIIIFYQYYSIVLLFLFFNCWLMVFNFCSYFTNFIVVAELAISTEYQLKKKKQK